MFGSRILMISEFLLIDRSWFADKEISGGVGPNAFPFDQTARELWTPHYYTEVEALFN